MKLELLTLLLGLVLSGPIAQAYTLEDAFKENHDWYDVTLPVLQQQAEQAGCVLKAESDDFGDLSIICVYPKMSVQGSEAVALINAVLGAYDRIIKSSESDCQMSWETSEPTGNQNIMGTMTIRSLPSLEVKTSFWFGQWYLYEYTKVDYNFGIENNFFVRHTYNVSGAAADTYIITVDEGGDSHLGMQQIINGETHQRQSCEVSW